MNTWKVRLTAMTFDILFVPGTGYVVYFSSKPGYQATVCFGTKDEAESFVEQHENNITTRVASREEG